MDWDEAAKELDEEMEGSMARGKVVIGLNENELSHYKVGFLRSRCISLMCQLSDVPPVTVKEIEL